MTDLYVVSGIGVRLARTVARRRGPRSGFRRVKDGEVELRLSFSQHNQVWFKPSTPRWCPEHLVFTDRGEALEFYRKAQHEAAMVRASIVEAALKLRRPQQGGF